MRDVIVNTSKKATDIRHWLKYNCFGGYRVIGVFKPAVKQFRTRNGTLFRRDRTDRDVYTVFEFNDEREADKFRRRWKK